MTSSNHSDDRDLQRDARAWAEFTGCTYTAALRQMESPLAQGFLGERVSARQLIDALENHPLVGKNGGDPVLGEWGIRSKDAWQFNQEDDYILLALIVDTLRMFTPLDESVTPEVGSYSLKHTVEDFLRSTDIGFSYVSNGRLIWAAAALQIPLAMPEPDYEGPNCDVGIPDHEHGYLYKMVRRGQTRPQGHHYRPPGFDHLQEALRQYAAGEPVGDRWVRPEPTNESNPFHDWLVEQAERGDPIGDFASDYAAGVRESYHRITRSPKDLMELLDTIPCSPEARRSAEEAVEEWSRMR